MIFGVPTGQHDIIMDFDLFDTNSFELTANDLVEQISLNNSVEQLTTLLNANANTNEDIENVDRVPGFKYLGNNNYEIDLKTNLDEMPNIFHQVKQITVSPFWGDNDACDVGITRCDFRINYKYTPTAIFFGFIQTTAREFYIDVDYTFIGGQPEIYGKDNVAVNEYGSLLPLQKLEVVVYRLDDKLTPGSRKRLGVYTGSFYNGIFRITLPMYTDYYITDESGELIPTSDTTLGIPTKGYYAFEIYDTDDGFTNRREPFGGFVNNIVPGVRIPSSTTGDAFLGGWEGTWTGLFEYDLLNRKRKYYTIKTIYKKHNNNNVLLPGDFISYFPYFNEGKIDLYWNFPLSYANLSDIAEPEIIGSVLVPRIRIAIETIGRVNIRPNDPILDIENGLRRPVRCVNEINIDKSQTFNTPVYDYEKYLGIGVKKTNGVNFGSVFTELFSDDDFIGYGEDGRYGTSIFGEKATWNYGDNTTTVFIPSLYASTLARKKGSNANGQSVHKAFNQVVNDQYTYGVFINSVIFANKEPLMEILIYDITDDLPDLIKDGVYSSYNKGGKNINKLVPRNNTEEIYVEDDTITTNPVLNNNSYKGNFYYFGIWKDANSLYDIEKNYFTR
jgi:hypothetical protein